MQVGLGLWRCGYGFGIVEVGCVVGLLQTKEKKSPERKRRTNREMNKKKFRYIILGSGIYYFIVVVILFYCDVYIILLY